MPQDPTVPPKPTGDSSPTQSGAGHVDLGKILLPKKPVPGGSVDSAERVNAGALLEQEQKASLPKPQLAEQKSGPKPVIKTGEGDPRTFEKQVAAKDETMISPLQTYRGDIESVIQNTNASTVSIAAAEAARRSQEPVEKPAQPVDWRNMLKRAEMVAGGLLLLAATGGILYFVYDHLNATVPVPEDAPAPFIQVDSTTPVALPPGGLLRTALMEALEGARQSNTLSLGLMGRFTLFETTQTEEGIVYTPPELSSWLPVLAPNLPQELLRTLTGTHVLGVHTYDGTQAFLLLEVDSYERAFAAMLAWERTMRGDLLPLFNREPRPRLPEEGVATSSVGNVPQLIQTGFTDKIVDNRDTRAIFNTSGDILLLWAPLGPNLLVITTNEYTLREIISRLGL